MSKFFPFGRVNEFLAKLTPEQRDRTATRQKSIFSDVEVKTFKTREAMAKAIRKQEKDNGPRPDWWSAVVTLTDGEGY